MAQKKNAFVLLFALSMLSLVTVLTHQLLRTVYVGWNFDRTMVDREHAEMLALGGVNLAIAQLTIEKKEEKKDIQMKVEPTKEDLAKKRKTELSNFFKRMLPHINRWQVFELNESVDGIKGEVKICITCEHGKININEAFDFKKQEFKPGYKKFLERIKFRGQDQSTGQFLKNLTKFLKERNRKIEDVSQLQQDAASSISQLWYDPPKRTEKTKEAKANKILALQDIFTIWTKDAKLEALFLSDALSSMLGLRRPVAYDAQTRKEKYKDVIKNFDPGLDQNNEKYWKIVNPLYESKSPAKLKDLKIFSSKFEPKVYSVLSSGKVGNVEQKLLAIIEHVPPKEENKKDEKDSKKKSDTKKSEKKQVKHQSKSAFKIVRLYWI